MSVPVKMNTPAPVGVWEIYDPGSFNQPLGRPDHYEWEIYIPSGDWIR